MLTQLLPDTPDQERRWSPGARIAFRFAFAWFLLTDLPFPLNIAPQLQRVTAPYDALWGAIVRFAGSHVFGLHSIANEETGSGDRTYDWIILATQLTIAIAITVVWSILDRRRGNYRVLYGWLRVYVRFALAAAMLTYGFYKVIPAQFPAPTLYRLTQTFGDASPMGLLWTFMGASAAYTIFAGLGELVGGFLLVFRRTTLLGALVSLAVLSNIVMLNFSYDVPVKIYSSELAIHALFLIAPDVRRLVDFFLLHRPTVPAPEPILLTRPALRRAAVALTALFVVIAVAVPFQQAWGQRRRFLKLSPLYGIWNVDEFQGGTPPWKRMIFHAEIGSVVDFTDGTRQRYWCKFDGARKTFTLSPLSDRSVRWNLQYLRPRPDTLVVSGVFAGKPVNVRMRAAGDSHFLLLTRGFHWINETPFNR